MKQLIERVANLFSIKSLITIMLTILFFILALKANIPQEVISIYTMVIAFYFGTQAKKE